MKETLFLATTALEETWDMSADKIVFLGNQCKLYPKRDSYNTDKFIHMASYWNNQAKVEFAASECERIYTKKIEELTKIYNNMFNISESTLYYERIFGYWLLEFINNIYDKFHTIKHAYTKYDNIESSVMNIENYYIPEDTRNYMHNSIDDLYSFQLYSQIIDNLSLKKKIINLKNKPIYSQNKTNNSLKHKIIYNVTYYLNKLFQQQKIIITSPYFNKSNLITIWNLIYKSNFKIVFDNFANTFNINNQYIYKRSKFNNKLFKSVSEFEKVLDKLIVLNIPKTYLEKFAIFRNMAANDTKRDANIYFTANAHYGNTYFKYKVAGSKNSKYFIMQHGGGYGLFKLHIGEFWETKVADKFYSFGWSNKKNTLYLAPSIFLHMPKKFTKKNNEILYITSTTSRYLRHFNGYGYWGDSAEELFINKRIEFLDKINQSIFIKLRMYPSDNSKLYEKQRIEDKSYSNVIFDDYSKDFLETLLTCKLHITDTTITTFLQALVYNIPTVCFSPAFKLNIADNAKHHIKNLVDANILFFSPIEAAKHVNSIYQNIDKWWMSSNVQNAKNNFLKEFAKASDNLENEWVNEFKRILVNNEGG